MAKDRDHDFYSHKKCGKPVCDKCGLIMLRNEATAKAVRKPCPGKEDHNDMN